MNKGNMRNGQYVESFDWPTAQDRFGGPIWPTLAKAYSGLNNFADEAAAKFEALKTDPELTPLGRKNQAMALMKGLGAAKVQEARTALLTGREHATGVKARVTASTLDKADAAGAVVRSDIRRHLQSMDPAKRAAMIRMGELDAQTLDAVLEAPPFLSGISQEQQDAARAGLVRQRNPREVEEIEAIGGAMQAINSAKAALVAVAVESGLVTLEEATGAIGDETSADRMKAITDAAEAYLEGAA